MGVVSHMKHRTRPDPIGSAYTVNPKPQSLTPFSGTLWFIAALLLGRLAAQEKNWLNLFSGALGVPVFFYVVTNTQAWPGDLAYAKTAAGWWQAMTV